MKKKDLFIGMMSGTSLDSVDAVLTKNRKVVESVSIPIYKNLKKLCLSLALEESDSIHLIKDVEHDITDIYASAYTKLVTKVKSNNFLEDDIKAIGAHGQTILHKPNIEKPYSLQIINGSLLSFKTKKIVICDFRNKIISAGGQGAPLAPIFHNALLNPKKDTAIINIGGIGNISFFESGCDYMTGFDTGPGNSLLDAYIKKHCNLNYDKDAKFSKKGRVIKMLLEEMLQDDFINISPPKSTGKDYFNLSWLNKYLTNNESPQDIMRTLVRFTALTILKDIPSHIKNIIVAGGGAKNPLIISDMRDISYKRNIEVNDSNIKGIDPQLLEAIGFSYFAEKNYNNEAVPCEIINKLGKKETIPLILGCSYK